MYAVIQTGGKQYKVSVGDIVEIEKQEANVGDTLTFDAIFVSDNNQIKIGKNASNVKVSAEVVEQGRADKVIVFKYSPKKRTRKKYGHRQPFTSINITKIG
ncbi:MAG: 50S ribosomal protein L21 [Clostridia bacterium]|jgi:large subunit ribosomal protein L21|nr:50S ribosomal protein L21 [Clostridia bacterium]MDD3231748.1 50S ribosomal protein L21 [Clostridia bacterium]MDD3862351.1 50S ribosomal protein L21 [Clostridia bacterium]MDD4408295.1 50S ribosomal protein L21 [Clostridia bacterium]